MIRMLTGTIATLLPDAVVVDVGGVGYLVHTLPSFTHISGERATVHTHLAVRENALDIYGFETGEELALFELLLTIPKVGPKSAMQFLVHAQVVTIKKAVIMEDPSYLSRLSDISQKNAEKIVLSLKGKIDTYDIAEDDNREISDIRAEVADALIALGYTPKDARDAARELPRDITDMQTAMRVTLATVSR